MVVFSNRYPKSQHLLARAEETIPLASQTFSKSYAQFPQGASPVFLDRGAGGRVWDIDGNEYVDLICGLLPVLLGYCDPEVDGAIKSQLAKGISFSLPTRLEMELAERLVDIVPCAEGVRFGKGGSDATGAAIRIARAATGRERIATCGYHGWHDWYVGATVRNKGIPGAVSELTHRFTYNDLGSLTKLLARYEGEFAAVILEPMSAEHPATGFLDGVCGAARAHGAVCIFDEVVTGFRYHLGGAQALFGVTPDLACFGKGMGNGMPISAVVGTKDLMNEMKDIFVSSTFGGEALSLAASIAVIDKLKAEPVIETIWETGTTIRSRIDTLIESSGLGDVISFGGLAPWHILAINEHPNATKAVIKTHLLRVLIREGVLLGGSHNICYAHNEADVEKVVEAYAIALGSLAHELKETGLEDRLDIPPIQPVFSVRS